MSRAGAIATRQTRTVLERVETLERLGLQKAAMLEHDEKEEARVDHAKQRLLALMAERFGVLDAQPYIDDVFTTYQPHQRVCVSVDGLVLNYWRDDREGKTQEGISWIAGICATCDKLPLLRPASTLDALGRELATPEKQTKCYACQKDESA